jgi:hypothetical protein
VVSLVATLGLEGIAVEGCRCGGTVMVGLCMYTGRGQAIDEAWWAGAAGALEEAAIYA